MTYRRRIVGLGRQAINRLERDAKFLALASGIPNSLQTAQGSPSTPDRAQYRTTEPPDSDRHPAATGTGRVPIRIALYARARTSTDPSTKQMLMRRADDLFKEAEELRAGSVAQAVFPKKPKGSLGNVRYRTTADIG